MGMPVRDERGMFERVCLEAFQSGASGQIRVGARGTVFRAALPGPDGDPHASPVLSVFFL
jgi:DNA-3-methyladenine glycosylase I